MGVDYPMVLIDSNNNRIDAGVELMVSSRGFVYGRIPEPGDIVFAYDVGDGMDVPFGTWAQITELNGDLVHMRRVGTSYTYVDRDKRDG